RDQAGQGVGGSRRLGRRIHSQSNLLVDADRRDPAQHPPDGVRGASLMTSIEHVSRPSRAVSLPYRGLHVYLNARYADRLVLTFSQIEDLLGFTLPDAARLHVDWWTDGAADGGPSPQSRAWCEARRTAEPNLFARTVVFERVPD